MIRETLPMKAGETKLPSVIVVIGVSGSGKSTIASMLAHRLNWEFADGDWFHPPANVEKMHSGVPLTDGDRWAWLKAIAIWINKTCSARQHGVVACSALKRSYRDILIGRRTDVRIVYLKGERKLIERRMAARPGHFMPVSLLDSQFSTLEEPEPNENSIVVSIDASAREVVNAILVELDATPRLMLRPNSRVVRQNK